MTIPDGYYIYFAPSRTKVQIVKVYSGSAYDGDGSWTPKTPSHYYPIEEEYKEYIVLKSTKRTSESLATFVLAPPHGQPIEMKLNHLQEPTTAGFQKGTYIHRNPEYTPPRFVTYDGTCMKYKNEIFQVRVPENYTFIPPYIVVEGLERVEDHDPYFEVATLKNTWIYSKVEKAWAVKGKLYPSKMCEVFLEGSFTIPLYEQSRDRSKRITSTVNIE